MTLLPPSLRRLDRPARVSLLFLALLGLVAATAELLAGDLPLLLRYRGELFVLPVLTRPASLREHDNQSLRRALANEPGWALLPPCPYGPEQQPETLEPLRPPGTRHLLGTDDRGRDVLARLLHGTRVSLLVGLGSVALNLLLGVPMGLVAGYRRGRTDFVISRVIEVGLTFPAFFLIIVIMALQERASLWTLVLVLGLTRWTTAARLARAEALRLRELDFVAAARAYGASGARIIRVHLWPNARGPIAVHATFGVAGAILVEAALSFLGFGAPPPTASWGETLSQGLTATHAWWLTVFPGLLLFSTVLSLNLLAEGLREATDPRTRPS